jgi:hypothetical protein
LFGCANWTMVDDRGQARQTRESNAMKPAPRRGVPFGWIWAVLAVLGAVCGVGLSLRQQANFDASLEDMEVRAARATPWGDPLWLPPARFPPDAGDPLAPDPASLRGIPDYPNAKPRGMVSPPSIQGVPMALSWFQTADSVETVVRYYDEYFRLLKLMHTTHVFHEGLGYSAWLEHSMVPDASFGGGTLHMVTAMRQGQETVVVFSATNPLAVLSAQAPQLPAGLALPPGASAPQVFELGETKGARLAIHSLVEGGTLKDVMAFYERSFVAGGWAVTAKQVEVDRAATFTATRGRMVQMVSLGVRPGAVDVLLSTQASGP